MKLGFPILGPLRGTIHGPRTVPWAIVAPFQDRAMKNHGGQTLERLAERGGLSPRELLLVLTDRPLHDFAWKMDEQDALDQIVQIMKSHETAE